MALFNEKTTRHVTELKTPFENFQKISSRSEHVCCSSGQIWNHLTAHRLTLSLSVFILFCFINFLNLSGLNRYAVVQDRYAIAQRRD